MAPEDHDVGRYVDEILVAVDEAGALEAWVATGSGASLDESTMEQVTVAVADQFLSSDPPQTGAWDHLLVTLAVRSSRNGQPKGLAACQAVISHLRQLLGCDRGAQLSEVELVGLASTVTVVLAIQPKLTHDVEAAMQVLCDHSPTAVPAIAEQCQGIWKRQGQMSGRPGLFLWDTRRQEWRLGQEFKPHRPTP